MRYHAIRLGVPVMMLCAGAACAGEFVEPQVTVHQQFEGTGVFGWAVSELGDIDGDGAGEAIVGAPYVGGPNYTLGDGRCYVYSGASGDLLMELAPGGDDENFGWSMADAPRARRLA